MILEELFAVARDEGLGVLEIGGMMAWTMPKLVDAACAETEERLIVERPDEMIAACGFIETVNARVPVSRWGDPRHGGKYIYWLGAVDESAVEDHFDERQRIIAAIDGRVVSEDADRDTVRGNLLDTLRDVWRTTIDLSSFDLEAFVAAHGARLRPADPFDVLTQVETRRDARQRQRTLHVRGLLDDEYLLEAGRDRARALAGAGCPGSERYAKIAERLDGELRELVDVRRRRLGVAFAVGQRSLDEAGLHMAMTLLRIACDDAQRQSHRVEPVLDAARRVAAYLPFSGGLPYEVGERIRLDIDRAFRETMMSVARVAFGKLLDLAWDCCDDARRTDREAAAERVRVLLHEEHDRIKAELGTT